MLKTCYDVVNGGNVLYSGAWCHMDVVPGTGAECLMNVVLVLLMVTGGAWCWCWHERLVLVHGTIWMWCLMLVLGAL